jgi:hypothetical protein
MDSEWPARAPYAPAAIKAWSSKRRPPPTLNQTAMYRYKQRQGITKDTYNIYIDRIHPHYVFDAEERETALRDGVSDLEDAVSVPKAC